MPAPTDSAEEYLAEMKKDDLRLRNGFRRLVEEIGEGSGVLPDRDRRQLKKLAIILLERYDTLFEGVAKTAFMDIPVGLTGGRL